MIIAKTLPKKGVLDARQLDLARRAQESDGRLDQVAVELGFSSEEDALRAVGQSLGMDFVDLAILTRHWLEEGPCIWPDDAWSDQDNEDELSGGPMR